MHPNLFGCGVAGAYRDKRVYTIKVKRKRKDGEFSFKDLEMYHCECYGGKMYQGYWHGDYLGCKRCGATLSIDEEEIMKFVKTAIDGKERKLKENGIVVQESD